MEFVRRMVHSETSRLLIRFTHSDHKWRLFPRSPPFWGAKKGSKKGSKTPPSHQRLIKSQICTNFVYLYGHIGPVFFGGIPEIIGFLVIFGVRKSDVRIPMVTTSFWPKPPKPPKTPKTFNMTTNHPENFLGRVKKYLGTDRKFFWTWGMFSKNDGTHFLRSSRS